MNILKRLLIISGLLLIVAGATYAAWTDQVTIGSNNFSTGSISISASPTSALFNATNIFPGWHETQSLVLTNDGTAPLTYLFSTTKSGSSTSLWDSGNLLLKVGTTSGAGDLYDGDIKAANFSVSRPLAIGANETLFITVTLASETPASMENKSAGVNFIFSASA